MSRWWRAHDTAVDNAKLQRLPDRLFKAWFNLCCVNSQNGGTLPAIEDVAFKLHLTVSKTRDLLKVMKGARLVDDNNGTLSMHDWAQHQYKADVTDPTNSERQQRYRNKKKVTPETPLRNGESNGAEIVTLKRPETETETEKERKQEPADAGPTSKKIVFESGVIRLNQKDLDTWIDAYKNIDVKAELLALTPWAADQENWFFAVSSALAKRNREMAVRFEQAKAGDAQAPPGKQRVDGRL